MKSLHNQTMQAHHIIFGYLEVKPHAEACEAFEFFFRGYVKFQFAPGYIQAGGDYVVSSQ
jgi:hypothetical protein